MAERAGFEPAVRFWRTHAFQACTFDRSVTSPCPQSLGRAILSQSTFPGFMIPSGSSVRLILRISSISTGDL